MSKKTCSQHDRGDFENLDGFIAALWGVVVHSFNHVTSWFWDSNLCVIPDERQVGREAMVQLFKLFLVLLYCKVCRKGYNEFWALEPADIDKPLAPWTLRLHNRINGKLQKPPFPERLFVPFHIDTCEQDAWATQTVSCRWALWFWSMQYLAALNHAPHFDATDERHRQVREAMSQLFQVMHAVIPSVAGEFKQAYGIALKETKHHLLYFQSREIAFHFVYELECKFNSHILAIRNKKSQTPRSDSIFGDSCTEVYQYFESVYRVETK